MPLTLSPEAQQQGIASIERYFREHMDEPIGNVAAGGLLKFLVEEVGPALYNQGVADAQENLQARVAELDIERPSPTGTSDPVASEPPLPTAPIHVPSGAAAPQARGHPPHRTKTASMCLTMTPCWNHYEPGPPPMAATPFCT